MSSKIQTEHGCAIPPAPRHSITVHLSTWDTILRLADRDIAYMNTFKSMYPRVILHKDVKELIKRLLEHQNATDSGCLPFPSSESALECQEFITSTARGEDIVASKDVSIRRFQFDDPPTVLHVVFFPQKNAPVAKSFWTNAGVGISSRYAENCLKHIESLKEISDHCSNNIQSDTASSSPQQIIRERLASLYGKNSTGMQKDVTVTPEDVFLFQTGMAGIYSVHKYLLKQYSSPSVLFGFAFSSTIRIFEEWGPKSKFLGLGSGEEINELERFLSIEHQAGRKIQAVWAEFPSNPLLLAPDLSRLRKLADKYAFVLIVDDTISSVCNMDFLGYADIVVTSLTKSFSGYSDVMAGSAVLNPSSPMYPELRGLFQNCYHDDLFIDDASVLESNSRDYLARSTILNNNAASLVEFLQKEAQKSTSSVAHVFYPTASSSLKNAQMCLRAPTEEFTPGYGCLLNVEFKNMESTIAFYELLNVHKGPHLGAHSTLAFPYTMALYGKELEWASKYNLRSTQIRVAVGLEDTKTLLQDFKIAIEAADTVWQEKK